MASTAPPAAKDDTVTAGVAAGAPPPSVAAVAPPVSGAVPPNMGSTAPMTVHVNNPPKAFQPIAAAAADAAPVATGAAGGIKGVPSRVSLSPDFTTSTSTTSLSTAGGEEKKDDSAPAKPTAAAAATAAAKKPEPSSPRRTGRKRTSTTMLVDGHVVKTLNNYTVTGMEYIHGAFKADAPKVKKAKAAPKQPSKPRSPRKVPEYVKARNAHNEKLKKRMFGEDNTNRLKFMARHREALEPFVEEKVKAHLEASAKRLPAEEEGLVLGAQPDAVVTTLRDYQMIGLDWMAKMHAQGMPFVLGDEMGLGKTLQAISLLCHLKETVPGFAGPSLVICPLSVLYSWCAEISKHAPSLKYFRFHSSSADEREAQKDAMLKDVLGYDIIVTTYEMAKAPGIAGLIQRTYFNLCILDEGHVIKSLTSQISEAVRKIHTGCRVILTGTPLQNNLVELYAILNYLYPQYFTTTEPFESAFDITHNRIDPGMLLKANKLLKLFMIRRLKGEVEKLMPKKIETKILCPLSSSQVFWYKGFLMNELESLVKLTDAENDEDEDGMRGKGTMLRNLVMQLRKVSLHPYLFDFAEPSMKDTSVEELIATSGKLAVLDKLLRSLFKNGHRTCIFSQFTSMLNILEDYCVLRGWRFCRFDGSTPRAQRNHIINQFNAPGSEDFIFLMSTRSGGLGLNLQTADTCILFDSDWNPQPDLQAMARVHRIGQKKTVHVYRLLCAGTVEERMVERAEKKLYLDQMVNRGTTNKSMDEEGGGLSTADLLATLKFGSNAVFSSANDMPTDKDIEKVTDRTRTEDDGDDGILQGGVAKTASDFDKDKELTDTRNFCGVDFRKLREEKEKVASGGPKNKVLDKLKDHWKEAQTGVAPEELGKGKRNRKSRVMQLAGNGSGWGSSHVPVLAMNNYDLEHGEPSAWGRETKKWKAPKKEKKTKEWVNQDFCQACGDGGMLIECPTCPTSMHEHCCGLSAKNFATCSHHRCIKCNKTADAAGGLLYRCESCPNAYCPDCMVGEPTRYLGITTPRYEKLGFYGNPRYYYIHCSKQCEKVAKVEFGFKPEQIKPKCPPTLNVSYAFGKDAMDVKDMAKMFKDKAAGVWEGDKKKSPPRAPGARISPRKRSPTAKSSAATGGVIDLTSPAPKRAGGVSYSPNPNAATGYI